MGGDEAAVEGEQPASSCTPSWRAMVARQAEAPMAADDQFGARRHNLAVREPARQPAASEASD
jgi:hypothetical protein